MTNYRVVIYRYGAADDDELSGCYLYIGVGPPMPTNDRVVIYRCGTADEDK